MSEETKFERCWAIVELFGHQKIAGEISDQTIAGATFLRVDVPEMDGQDNFTRFFGASAIYSITPVSEEVARLAAGRLSVRPVTIWMPEIQKRLPSPAIEIEYGDEEELEF